MAYTVKGLGQTLLADTATTIYTVPGATTAIVRDIMICNTDTTSRTFTIWLDISGTGATDSEAIFDTVTIDANDYLHWTGFQVMTAASTIKGVASVASVINVTVSGVESA